MSKQQWKTAAIAARYFSSGKISGLGHRISPFLLGFLVVLGAVSGCSQDGRVDYLAGQQDQVLVGRVGQPMPTPTQQGTNPNPGQLQGERQLITAIQEVVEAVRPAVVFISVRAVTAGEFLQPVPRQGVGSGVIYDPSGLILTNNHVIQDAGRIRVVVSDDRVFEARVIGRDPLTDVAVLKIDGENLPTAPLGNSSALRVGQWVVAIGNALGLEGGPTVTEGIVSALERSIETDGGVTLENLIQTSAAINPGNSGGPLVNLDGEVVGINTAVAGPTQRGFQPTDIGFAIAIDAAKPIVSELVQRGRVLRPFLGVDTVTVTPALAAHLDLSVQRGALIVDVVPDSPAAIAGLVEGDVIVGFTEQEINSAPQLRRAIMGREIGETVTLTVVRDGQKMQLSPTLQDRPAPPEVGNLTPPTGVYFLDSLPRRNPPVDHTSTPDPRSGIAGGGGGRWEKSIKIMSIVTGLAEVQIQGKNSCIVCPR